MNIEQIIHQNQTNEPVLMDGKATMTSLELRDLINVARKEFGEPIVENSHFLKRVEDELDGELSGCKTFATESGGTPMRYYDLTFEQCLLRKERGVTANHVPDGRYGKVRAWPAGAWLDCFGVDLKELFGGEA